MALKEVTMDTKRHGPVSNAGLVRFRLKMRWAAETAESIKSRVIDLTKFTEFQVSSGPLPYEWDSPSVSISPEGRRLVVLEGRSNVLGK